MASHIVTPNRKFHGPHVVGAVQHDVIANTATELHSQNAVRMWNKYKPKDNVCDELEPLHLVEFLVFSELNFISRLSPDMLNIFTKVLNEQFDLPDEAVSLHEWHRRSAAVPLAVEVPTTASLFRNDVSLLSWVKSDTGAAHLLADLYKIVENNSSLFECTASHGARYVRNVLESNTFKRRYARLVALCEMRTTPIKPYLFVGPRCCKADALVFSVFLRSCKGIASDAAIAQDALKDALVGLGDYGVVSEMLAEAMSSTATEEECASFGIDRKSQKDALDKLTLQVIEAKTIVAEALAQSTAADSKANEALLQSNAADVRANEAILTASAASSSVQEARNEFQEVMAHVIPTNEQLRVNQRLIAEKLLPDDAEEANYARLFVGSLVTEFISKLGMKETIGRDGDRNVYSNNIQEHVDAFEDAISRFPAEFPAYLARAQSVQPTFVENSSMQSMSVTNWCSKLLAEAGPDRRNELFRNFDGADDVDNAKEKRQENLSRIFMRKAKFALVEADKVFNFYGEDYKDFFQDIFIKACNEYLQSRDNNKKKRDAAAKAKAKAAAKEKPAAKKRCRRV